MTIEGKGQGARHGKQGQGARHAKRAAGRFDAFDVAARRAVIEGRLDAASFPRVDDLLAPETGEADLAYRIEGSADAALRPALEIALDGSVTLTCQRCLQPFAWPIEQRTLLLLAHDEQELERLDEEDHEHEVILAHAPLDILELVEDELLLTLPFAPRCPDEVCPAAASDEFAAAEAAGAKPSAFDVLAELKTR